jgi:hypothetical protein
MKKIATLILLIVTGYGLKAQQAWPEDLILTPEKSNFEKTSTYGDVMNFINAIKTKSPNIKVTPLARARWAKRSRW